MTRRTSIIDQMGAYFASKGKVLTADEYKNADDVPIRFQLVKRGIGSWSRLINMVGDISQYDGATTVPATSSAPAPTTEEPVAPTPVEEAPVEEAVKEEEKVAPTPKTSEKQK
jgi:hypothetical protein